LLKGEVDTWTLNDDIFHRFILVVPALEDYRYSLFRLHHPPTLYPVYIDESPIQDRNIGHVEKAKLSRGLQTPKSFRNWLRKALASAETKRILDSLLAQAIA
jgi:hypothetical protein